MRSSCKRVKFLIMVFLGSLWLRQVETRRCQSEPTLRKAWVMVAVRSRYYKWAYVIATVVLTTMSYRNQGSVRLSPCMTGCRGMKWIVC